MKMNLPNKLTILRMCLVPVFVFLMLGPWALTNGGRIAAGILFIAASLTDTLDGYLARKNNEITVFGKFMDPLADKLLVCSAMICLVDLKLMPGWIVIVIIAREFIISGYRLVAAEKGIGIAAGLWGKLKTVAQMIMVILLVFPFTGILHTLGLVFMWIALVLTIVSLVDYILKNRDVLSEVH